MPLFWTLNLVNDFENKMNIKMLEEELTQEEYAATVQKGDKELLTRSMQH